MKDSVVEETRKYREELCAEFDNDLHKASQYFIDLQSHSRNVYVTKEMLLKKAESKELK